LDIVRLGEGDERIAPAVRVVLHGVKARTYGGLGDADACRKRIEAAEEAFTRASPGEAEWVGKLANVAKLYAITGHALADLAEYTGKKGHRAEAIQRLGKAVEELDSTNHARAYLLCLSRLTALQVVNGDLSDEERPEWIRKRVPEEARVRSGRVSSVGEAGPTEESEGGRTPLAAGG
jgi:hypothetical protein